MQVAYSTHVGKIREINEDRLYVDEPNLFIIADGMGGHNAGEVASNYAVDFVKNYLSDDLRNNRIDCEDIADRITEAIMGANKFIFDKAREDDSLSGMGTTMVCLILNGKKAFIANVGDSRLYFIRDNSIRQVTRDHSYVSELLRSGNITENEAENHPQKNLITRAIGYSEKLEADVHVEEVRDNDIIIMCTDGVTNMICDSRLKEIALSKMELKEICNMIISEANSNGGTDNSTLIIIKV